VDDNGSVGFASELKGLNDQSRPGDGGFVTKEGSDGSRLGGWSEDRELAGFGSGRARGGSKGLTDKSGLGDGEANGFDGPEKGSKGASSVGGGGGRSADPKRSRSLPAGDGVVDGGPSKSKKSMSDNASPCAGMEFTSPEESPRLNKVGPALGLASLAEVC
jgi:hypothetical protein